MDKLSPYYANYIKGVIASQSNSLTQIRIAAENLEEALQFKLTPEAYNALLVCYMRLDDENQYEATLLDAAENFPYFCSSCGLYYANGKKFDKEKSLSWFNKGIEKKEPKAFYDLGTMYFKGCKAFSKDVSKAEEVLKQGLELNNPKWNGSLNYYLGLIAAENEDYKSAAEYFKNAQQSGFEKASYNLALLYRDGLGVKKDYEAYIMNLLRNLDIDTSLEIGHLFLNGKYVAVDKGISLTYFDFAAKNGNAQGALMSAALLIDKGNANSALLTQYLNLALSNKAVQIDINKYYEEIEKSLGQKVREELQTKISNNSDITKNAA